MQIRHFLSLIIISLLLPILWVGPVLAENETPAQIKEALEQELADIERQIAQFEKQLTTTKNEKQTLTVKIKKLKTEQANLQLQIKATNLKIKDLDNKLKITQNEISKTVKKSTQLKQDIAAVLILLNQKDRELLLESLSQNEGLAGAYVGWANYQKLFIALRKLTKENKQTQSTLNQKHAIYNDQQDDARELLALKGLEQRELGNSLSEQATLLTETKGKEDNYQKLLQDKRKRAAEIRNRIYEILGGGKQINFGEALSIAEWVSAHTKIRPAFLLAILTQESNLGKNVGTCNRAGDPAEKSWRVIMKPERDQEPFLKITEELGLNPDTTPLSCPMKDKNGKQLGWGGAMGPAQFIPSTWMGYRGKVTALTGKSFANPWDIRDAFAASAIKLTGDGADGTEDGEWKAAMRYFAGSVNLKYRFYGDNVLKLTKKYEEDIKNLKEGTN